MNKFIIPLIAFALLVVVLAVGVKHSPENTIVPSALVGHPAPEFNLPELLEPGTTVSSSELKGKPYVINVWATWCVTCRIEHPVLVQLKQLGQVPIIGINWRDEDDLARQWLAEFGNPYTHVPVDKEGRAIIDLGVTGAPETFLVNSKGIIVHRHVGALSLEAWKKDFEPLIRADLGTAANAAGSAAPGPT
ncbi:MAG: DsbE family thiol:disulfide interchange protein [Steroidobacteraceae bacterium]|nr:DsbE family thiol:disulfide interchange protein [Steroidobacteraceae bacterium]